MSITTFYVGTYSDPILMGAGEYYTGKGNGIYHLSFDDNTGVIINKGCIAASNTSFLQVSADKRFLMRLMS